jgi:glycosyltransferase involved in cell wall biosynthesis
MPLRKLARRLAPGWRLAYRLVLAALWPLNMILSVVLRGRVHPNSVLHVSYMVHIPYYTTRLLRAAGMKADYLSIGASPLWSKADFQKIDARDPIARAIQEFMLLWRVVARYEILHLHFMISPSLDGWELPILKRMGRRIVIHYRGCEIRDREKNMRLHPKVNICQRCDYNATICTSELNRGRRERSRRYGDAFLATTPDLLDFVPQAEHVPFYAPDVEPAPRAAPGGPFRIVHVTGHPGIEGTDEIRGVIERLRAKGYDIDFRFLSGVTHDEVLEAYRGANLAIGKMKMGYYANAQIESMTLGVPTVTYVRPEFMTDELRRSGFIFADLASLERVLERYLSDPAALAKKRALARVSVLRMHDGALVARKLIAVYDRVRVARAHRSKMPFNL